MSPRSKSLRKVLNPPRIKGFRPYGPELGKEERETVYLLLEEYEALRLCDYDHSNHRDASMVMNVSRPTFTRIYASALRKLAAAFVEGRPIAIEGGKVYFDSDWYFCHSCGCNFNHPDKNEAIVSCALCGSRKIEALAEESEDEQVLHTRCEDFCICRDCGHESRHIRGVPCSEMICPECKGQMRRKKLSECKESEK